MTLGKSLLCLAITAISFAALADSYTIEPLHTYPSLEMSHMGISVWRGRFDKTSGKVTLDRKAKTGTVDIEVKTDSIDFGLEAMHEYAAKPEWLDFAKFPTMNYQGTLKFKGDAPTSVEGQLTLKGITKPLTLRLNSFTCIDHPYYKKEVCGADAEGDLDRADFGMTQYTDNGAGKIHLRIQVEALKD